MSPPPVSNSVLISRMGNALVAKLGEILAAWSGFGLAPEHCTTCTVDDVFGALLLDPNWRWVSVGDVEEALPRVEGVSIDGDRVEVGDQQVNAPREALLDISQEDDRELFWPMPLRPSFPTLQLQGQWWKLYSQLDVALLIAAHQEGDPAAVRIGKSRSSVLSAGNVEQRSLSSGLVLAFGAAPNPEQMLEDSLVQDRLQVLRYRMVFLEAIYLEDSGHRSNACGFLYSDRPQSNVEEQLLPYLNDPDRYVRMNACQAISHPAYSISIKPGEPMPDWEESLEHLTVQLGTARALLDLVKTEEDVGVIDYALCALKAQNHSGRLKPLVAETRSTVRDTIPKLQDPRTISDSKKLLRYLRILDEEA